MHWLDRQKYKLYFYFKFKDLIRSLFKLKRSFINLFKFREPYFHKHNEGRVLFGLKKHNRIQYFLEKRTFR